MQADADRKLRAPVGRDRTGVCIVAIAACGHAPPADSGGATTARKDDDPWIVRGSVTGGPIIGNPTGPYSPRQRTRTALARRRPAAGDNRLLPQPSAVSAGPSGAMTGPRPTQ